MIFRMNYGNKFFILHILYLIYEFRGILLFLWMLTCPLFRKITKDTLTTFLCGEQHQDKMDDKGDYEEFDELLNRYNNTNSFLYSSLNMEIVCSILKGINIILRDINSTDKK